jgi:hypothetical protein
VTERVPARRIIDDADALNFPGRLLRPSAKRRSRRCTSNSFDEIASSHRLPQGLGLRRLGRYYSRDLRPAEWEPIVIVAQQQSSGPNVCFGSEADVTLSNFDVRFTPESRHCQATVGCPLWANNGHQFSLEVEDATTL